MYEAVDNETNHLVPTSETGKLGENQTKLGKNSNKLIKSLLK